MLSKCIRCHAKCTYGSKGVSAIFLFDEAKLLFNELKQFYELKEFDVDELILKARFLYHYKGM
jgi:hypothetical protein